MQILERSLKRRACELINNADQPTLAYIDQPWDELVPRLIEVAEPVDSLTAALLAVIAALKPLNDMHRKRVVAAASAFLGVA